MFTLSENIDCVDEQTLVFKSFKLLLRVQLCRHIFSCIASCCVQSGLNKKETLPRSREREAATQSWKIQKRWWYNLSFRYIAQDPNKTPTAADN